MAVIVQAANFVAPRSGGIRTALDALGRGYLAAGHQPVLLAPGPRDADTSTPAGRRVSLRGVPLPASGGYRVLVERRRVLRLLERLGPDRLEVSDKLTLAGLGPWARSRGIPAVLVSHERLDQLLSLWRPGSATAPRLARAWNRRLAVSFDTVVCSTRWAAEEFQGLGAARVARVPLGVDLAAFTPDNASPRLRRRLAPGGGPLLVYAGRLASEKRPELAEAVAAVLAWDPAERRARARARAAGYPWSVTVTGMLGVHGLQGRP